MKPSPDLSARVARLVFCLLMLMAWTGAVEFAGGEPLTRAASQGAGFDPRKAISDAIDQTAHQAEQIQRNLPRDSFDPAALVQKLGKDPVTLFSWVRDQTYWVPYRGVLRSDRGVLMERIGNSIDRSILLYSLLKTAGRSARLAHGQLDADLATKLLAQVRVPGRPQAVATRPTAQIDRSLQTRLEKLQLPVRRLQEGLAQRVVEQTPVLIRAIGSAAAARRPEVERAASVESLRDHWWVQVQQESGWQDLDPLLPDSQPGHSLRTPEKTFQPQSLTDLDESMLQVVQVQLIIEILDKGKVSEKPVLTQKLLPAAFAGQRIAISHSPVAWPKDLNLIKAADPLQEFKQTLLRQLEWMPVMVAGGRKIARYTFTTDGTINDPTLPTYVQAALSGRAVVHGVESGSRQTGGAVGGILGSGRIGDAGLARRPEPQPAKPDAAAPDLTAEWIEYRILIPGQPPRIIRREIFDLLGPSARAAQRFDPPSITDTDRLRRGLALLGETEIMPLAGRLSPQYLLDMVCQSTMKNRAALQDLLAVNEQDAAELADRAAKIEPMSSELLSLAALRQSASVDRNDIYLERPNIFSRHQFIRLNEKGDLVGCTAMDIVANDIAILPGSSVDPFRTRVRQGVFDTNAEAMLDAGCAQVENTGEMLYATVARGEDWLEIRRPDDPAWTLANLPRDFRARVNEDLVKGFLVVAPRQPLRLGDRWTAGWWRIDPASGQTLGMGARGWGQTATERLMITSAVGIAVLGFCFAAGVKEHSAFKGTLCFLGMSCCAIALVLVLLTLPEFVFMLAEATSGSLLLTIPEAAEAAEMIEWAEKLKFVCELGAIGSIPGDVHSVMGGGEPKEGTGSAAGNPGGGARGESGGDGANPPAGGAGGGVRPPAGQGTPPLGPDNGGYKNGYPKQYQPYPPPPDWRDVRDFPDV